jgi:hypothetical protein
MSPWRVAEGLARNPLTETAFAKAYVKCCMRNRQKETKFLKALIQCDESGHGQQLQDRISKAEKDEKCIRCALYLVGLLLCLSVSGLGYSAVFVPQFARYSSHTATKVFCALGLGSLICAMVFWGCWLWYRAVSNRVFEDCRRFLRAVLESRINQASVASPLPATTSGSFKVHEPHEKDQLVMTSQNNTQLITKNLFAAGMLLCGTLVAFAQAPAPAPVIPRPEPKSPWEESAGFGLTLTRGNSRPLLFTANGLATRKTKLMELDLDAEATYGEALNKSTGQEEKNANSRTS